MDPENSIGRSGCWNYTLPARRRSKEDRDRLEMNFPFAQGVSSFLALITPRSFRNNHGSRVDLNQAEGIMESSSESAIPADDYQRGNSYSVPRTLTISKKANPISIVSTTSSSLTPERDCQFKAGQLE
ncbi:MAG: hypothetical protein CM1200mP22_18350 [Dehalococcoidia bacterium]|nr:MAG: hypothetical protein CM1200mP22_18350 [Dehalococcoidia bacterium]